MSAYREVTTQMNDMDCLVDTLKAMKSRNGKTFNPIVHKEKAQLEGYQGDKRSQRAEIILPRAQVGSASNDIGFERGADGNFVAHVSDYDKAFYNDKWMNEVKSEYTKTKVARIAKKAGAKKIGERKNPDGSVTMKYVVN